MLKKLSVAYSVRVIPVIEKYKDYINDVYYSDGKYDSARGCSTFDEGEYLSVEELRAIKSMGIKLNYVLNPSFIPNRLLNHRDEIINHLVENKELIDIVTVNNLILANNNQFMTELKKHFEIKNSVNNHIDTELKVKELCERFPLIDNVILDRSINRDPEKIKRMCDIAHSYNKKVTVLVNEGCLFNCIFKRDCDLTFSTVDSEEAENNLTFNCYKENFKKKNWEYLKSPWMTAECVEKLENYVDYFKISGRYDPPEEIEKRIKYYLFNDRNAMLREILDKVLSEKYDVIYNLSMMEMSAWGVTRKLTDCKNDCLNCTFCEHFIKQFKDIEND